MRGKHKTAALCCLTTASTRTLRKLALVKWSVRTKKGELMNTWPGGYRHAMHQDEHEAWNSWNYPGTRQLCEQCDGLTGRCEDDSIYLEDGTGPLCLDCYHKSDEYQNSQPGNQPD